MVSALGLALAALLVAVVRAAVRALHRIADAIDAQTAVIDGDDSGDGPEGDELPVPHVESAATGAAGSTCGCRACIVREVVTAVTVANGGMVHTLVTGVGRPPEAERFGAVRWGSA